MNGLQGTSRERNEFAARHFQDRAQRWTELYDDRDREAHGFLVRRDAVGQQLESVPRREGEQGVDLGCGSGPYLGGLSSRCVRVVGVDVAPAMIDEARRNLSSDVTNVDLVVASILDLPYPPDTFDVGVCVGVLEYFDDPGAVLRSAFRAMRPGGSLVFTVPNFFGISRLSGLPRTITVLMPPKWKVVIGPALDRLRGRDPDPSRYYLGASFTPARMRRLCREAGLEVVEITSSGYEGLRFVGIPAPAKTEFAVARRGEVSRRSFLWRCFGNNLIVTVKRPDT